MSDNKRDIIAETLNQYKQTRNLAVADIYLHPTELIEARLKTRKENNHGTKEPKYESTIICNMPAIYCMSGKLPYLCTINSKPRYFLEDLIENYQFVGNYQNAEEVLLPSDGDIIVKHSKSYDYFIHKYTVDSIEHKAPYYIRQAYKYGNKEFEEVLVIDSSGKEYQMTITKEQNLDETSN